MIYARETQVSTDKSKAEIESTLRRYGADQFMSGWKDGHAAIQFRIKNKMVRFVLPLPDDKSQEFTHYKKGSTLVAKSPEHALAAWEQSCRQRWRALSLAIKAKLEAVECGITSFEEEFLAHIIVPGSKGMTVAQYMLPDLERSYETQKAPQLEWK